MRMLTKGVPIYIAISMFTTATMAQKFEPGSYMTNNGVELTPTLMAGVGHTNNFFSTPEDEESRLIWTFAPTIDAIIEDGVNKYNFNAATLTNLHNIDSADNFTQINLKANTHHEFSSRQRLDFSASADWLYEPRGSGLTEGLGDLASEPVEYTQQNILLDYEYGAMSSAAQIAFKAGYYNKDYQNFESISQYRNYDKTLFGVTGYYNTQAGTRSFLELKSESYRYDVIQLSGISRDSDDHKVLLGIEWEATAITSGSFKVGYQKKDFKDTARENFSGLSWEGDIIWQPLTYSSFKFNTSRSAKDPLVEGDFIKESTYNLYWSHEWNESLGSLISFSYVNEDYTGDVGRKDKTETTRLSLNYSLNNVFLVSPYIDFLDKQSTESNIEFDRVLFGINFTFGLRKK